MTYATNTDLLIGLQDPGNDRVWSAFYGRHQPLLVSFGRQLGLADPDAQDAAHDALLAFAEAYRAGQYQRGKGRLRSWLFGIARNKIRDLQRQAGRENVVTDADAAGLMSRIPDERTWETIWNTE